MFRSILFVLSLSIFCTSGYELNRRFQASNLLLLENAPLNQADTFIAQAKWDEAKMLAQFLRERPDLGNIERAKSIEIAADSALDSSPISSQAFLDGIISGEAENTSSLLGALALDLFVLGDIRDLVVQGYKEITDQESDKIILALSATGLTLSLVPQLHWAPALMKNLKRSGAFSAEFLQSLRKISSKALSSGDYKPLAALVTDFASTTKHLGIAPTKGAFKAVQASEDVTKLAGAAKLYPKRTYALSVLAGTRGVKLLNKTGDNIAAVSQKLKLTSRLAKSAKKSFAVIPQNFVIGALIVSLMFMIWALFSRRRN